MKNRMLPILMAMALSTASLLLCSCDSNEQSDSGLPPQSSANEEGTVHRFPQSYDALDEGIECEEIVLQKATALKELVSGYYNPDSAALAFEMGDIDEDNGVGFGREVASDKFSTYAEFKSLYSDDIYEGYIDFINNSGNGFRENDGKLYYTEYPTGGVRGSAETWYLGYDVEGDKIAGHFAELEYDIGGDEPLTAEYLNDESNYSFYDLIIQKTDGKYVVTDCVNSDGEQRYMVHGICYNSGAADKTLITSPDLAPKG